MSTEPNGITMRSDTIKKGDSRAAHRSLLRATGVREGDWDKPFIAICNSHVDIIPGHVHLQEVGNYVKECVRAAGGVPFLFNTIGVDDGIAMGHMGMKYSLPSRELIADSVETMIEAHRFDAMICIPNCDKIVPGMLMGAARANVPTVFVSGGPMSAGHDAAGNKIDLISVFEGVGARAAGTIDDARLAEFLEQPLRDAEGAAVRPDVLAEDEHLRIAAHLFDERFADRFEVRQLFAHISGDSPRTAGYAYRSVRASAGSGSGAVIANSTASSIVDVTRASMSLSLSSSST